MVTREEAVRGHRHTSGRHSRASGNLAQKAKLDSRLRGNDGVGKDSGMSFDWVLSNEFLHFFHDAVCTQSVALQELLWLA